MNEEIQSVKDDLKEINEAILIEKIHQVVIHWPDPNPINRPNWFFLLGWFLGRGLAYPDAKRLADEIFYEDTFSVIPILT